MNYPGRGEPICLGKSVLPSCIGVQAYTDFYHEGTEHPEKNNKLGALQLSVDFRPLTYDFRLVFRGGAR